MKPHEWRWAIRDMPLDGTAKVVAWALSTRMNGDNACWPSKTTLCEDCGLSIRTVDRAVRRLEIVGLVKVRRRPPAPNVYIACLPRHSDGVTPSEKTPRPRHSDGESSKEENNEVRQPLTATAAAASITVDAEMLQLARGWLASSGAHH